MKRDLALEASIVEKHAAIAPVLDERARRLWAATESRAIGFGGDALVSAATGLARETIRNGRREIEHGIEVTGRVRRVGAGRPRKPDAKKPVTFGLEPELIDFLKTRDHRSQFVTDLIRRSKAFREWKRGS